MVPPASKRIRSTDKRLGPREEAKPKSESGFKIYVSNLHPKVTQEDIVVSITNRIFKTPRELQEISANSELRIHFEFSELPYYMGILYEYSQNKKYYQRILKEILFIVE